MSNTIVRIAMITTIMLCMATMYTYANAVVVTPEIDIQVGDAYARAAKNGLTWTVGNSAMQLKFQSVKGDFRLVGFQNKLYKGVSDYVDPGIAAAPFLAENRGGFQTDIVWAKSLKGQESADPAADNLRLVVKEGDLIGFNVDSHGDANGDNTQWITRVEYEDGEHYVSSEEATLNQGPIWYYCIHKKGTRFLEYLDSVEEASSGVQYNIAGQPIAGSQANPSEAKLERFRCTSTYCPYAEPRFAPLVNATRLHPSSLVGAVRVWRAPKDGSVKISGVARLTGGEVDVEVIRLREQATADAEACGSVSGWRLDNCEAHEVNAGGRPAVRLDVNLSKEALRAHYHVIAYPGASVLRHWVELENAGDAPISLKSPDHFSIRMPSGPLTHYWMFGGDSRANSGLLQSAAVSGSYHKATIGSMTDYYVPWMAMTRQGQNDGWFMAAEYHTAWIFGVDRDTSGHVTVSASLPELAGYELAPGSRVKLPTITLGVFRDSLDDMARRVYDWQYEYMWDFTNDEWYARPQVLCNWYNDVHNLQENFAGRLGDLDMTTADMMRTSGGDLMWDDAGWSESPGIWSPTREGPDFAETNRHMSKSGMKWLLWFCGVPSAGLMDTKVGSWGDFQWRTDGFAGQNLASVEGLFNQVTTFLTKHPRSSFHTCCGGSRYSHTFDVQRYADLNYGSDGGEGEQTNYYLSCLETPDKWMDLVPVLSGKYLPETTRQILSAVPCWHLTSNSQTNRENIEHIRRVYEIYRYLTHEGVAGRRSYVAHPVIKGDVDYYYLQRISQDRKRACIIFKHKAPGEVTIYPRELLVKHKYVVGFDSTKSVSVRTGADLMTNGITITNQPPGELIYLGLPTRPGSGVDKTPPTAPGSVLSRRETSLGHSGSGIYWSPGSDENFVSYYEVRRNDKILGKASTGTFFFDHSPGWDPGAKYAVRTLDGDGNASGWIQAKPAMDEPLTFAALGGHFQEAGREGWCAGTSIDGAGFQPMTFVPPARDPGGDFGGTGNQPGGVEGYWEGAGTARCGRGWQQASTDAQCIRKWIAPRSGTVRILGRAMKEHYRRDKGAALRVRIMQNDLQIWPASGWTEVPVADDFGCPHDVTVTVAAGDAISFVLDRGTDRENDIVAWMPRIVYTDPQNSGDAPREESVVRILCGSRQSYVDSLGNTWRSDGYYSGGHAMRRGNAETGGMITQDDMALYELGREGEDFTYTIPVKPGLYTVRLLFAERKHEWSFERPFNLTINGRQVMRNFDVCQAARGSGRAYARVYRYLVPDESKHLVLRFTGGFDPLRKSSLAMVQAIEILPELKSTVRIDVGADKDHIDWNSYVWSRDVDYQGGKTISSVLPVTQASPTLHDQRLYQTARTGRELIYKIAVPPGLYSVHLKFAELWLSEPGKRPMNIEINGRMFWTNWDPALAAGTIGMAADIRSEDVTPDKDGKITVRIVAAGSNDAILQGLEIE
ncbi:MAG: malectin domain-containing carbohydrate-binding protein [Armatimonadota bacterium]